MKIRRYIFITILSIVFTIGPAVVLAHPGRTDSSGGHTCRTNCPNWGLEFGEYHYHRAKALPQSKPPIKSKFGENGTGYTTPAPEYQIPITTTKPKIVTPSAQKQEPIQTEEQPKEDELQKAVEVIRREAPKRGFWQWLFSIFK